MTILAGYSACLLAFVSLDMVWLGTMIERLYRPALGDILAPTVNLRAAIVFYLIFPIGLMIFVVMPAAKAGAIGQAALLGGLFGFFAYATYDLTNQATVRGWSVQLTVIDMAWGFVLSSAAATIGYLVVSRLQARS